MSLKSYTLKQSVSLIIVKRPFVITKEKMPLYKKKSMDCAKRRLRLAGNALNQARKVKAYHAVVIDRKKLSLAFQKSVLIMQ